MGKRIYMLWLSPIGVIILPFTVSILVMGCTGSESANSQLYFGEDYWDYGTLGIGEEAIHVFEFHNKGDTELEVTDVDSTCSCTTALIQGKKIKPGGTGELKVSFRENNEKGKLKRAVKVYVNGQSKPAKAITIKAFVVETYTVNPSQLFFDKNGTKQLEISYPDDMNLQVTKVDTSSKYLSAIVSNSRNEGDKSILRVDVRLSAPPTIKKTYDQVVMHTNKNIPDINIPVLIASRNSINIQPSKLIFGSTQNGGVIRRAFISIPDGSPSRIQSIKSDSNAVSADIVKQNDQKYEIVVKLKSDAPFGIFRDKIMVYTSDKKNPVLELPVYGTILPK